MLKKTFGVTGQISETCNFLCKIIIISPGDSNATKLHMGKIKHIRKIST
jgi:hypothetical protein